MRITVDNLWKKEHRQTGVIYVNLFESLPKQSCIENEWINFHSFDSLKDNQHSTELRMNGNTEFRMHSYAQAMNMYNQSLCFAEIGSENISLAYANRSACFFHMQMYKEALIDIEMAKNANLSDRLMSKLDERKKQCAELMILIGKPPKNAITLSYEANPYFSCMANVLDIKQNEEFGRHLVAKCDIPAGNTVLIEEDFVSMRSDDEPVCCTCFQAKTNFIACAQCPDVVFCNQECMTQNFIHKWHCGSFFAQLHYKIQFQMHTILLAIETFSSVANLMEFVGNILAENPAHMPSLYDTKSKYHFFFKLEISAMHLSKHLAQIKQIYEYVMALPKVRVLFDSADKRYFLMHLVAHHFLVIKTNAIVSRNPWSVISVFNVLSMLNHSCAPNLYHPRQGKRQYGVTVRPVKKGQQLFISYLSLNDQSTKEQRQQKLKSSWRFDCKCEKCEPTEAPFDLELTESDSCYRFLIENYDDKNNTEKLPTLFANCVEFLNKYAQSQWTTAISTIIAILVNLYIEMLP